MTKCYPVRYLSQLFYMAVQPSFCTDQLAKQKKSVLLWELAQLREKISILQEQAYDELHSSFFLT